MLCPLRENPVHAPLFRMKASHIKYDDLLRKLLPAGEELHPLDQGLVAEEPRQLALPRAPAPANAVAAGDTRNFTESAMVSS